MNHLRALLLKCSLLLAFAQPGLRAAEIPPFVIPESAHTVPATVSLAGTWRFLLDTEGKAMNERIFMRLLNDTIELPGTTDQARKGKENTNAETKRLTRLYPYSGRAWYQREVVVPEAWRGRRVALVLERSKYTNVWMDDLEVDSRDTLVGEQLFDMYQDLTPGKHRITICVDNKRLPPIGDPHQISDQTQTNWNGVLGKIELRVTDTVWIRDLQLDPDVANRKVRVRLEFGGKPTSGVLTLSARTVNTDKTHLVPEIRIPVELQPDQKTFETDFTLGEGTQLWDEFSPTLYQLDARFSGELKGRSFTDKREVQFGMRQFTAQGTQFSINGKTTFLRGRHDACVFPLTGYPPMQVDEWVRIFNIAKSYGINHYRFHTWCPPEAAFTAADRAGIYLQPELPIWGPIGAPSKMDENDVEQRRDSTDLNARTRYLTEEGQRLFRQFGNHPSFVMFSLGNEMSGSREEMENMVAGFRAYDHGRRLFAQGSNNFLNAPQLAKGDDYWTTALTGGHYKTGVYQPDTIGKLVRGSTAVHTVGHINNELAGTSADFSKSIEGISVPVIGHETGQFETYPDYHQIEKYTGVLRAKNLERFRNILDKNGMLAQGDDFARASGALAVLCYREEIEAALRTPGFGGFQLLDLQDFPGQGTALVGILDAFMDSKGLITPDQWREFCSETVPLVRHKSYTWTNGQIFEAEAEVAHYGAGDLPKETPQWTLAGADGKTIASGKLATTDIARGKLTQLGKISIDLSRIPAPQKLTLTLELPVASRRNSYPLWIYPADLKSATPGDVKIARLPDSSVQAALEAGGKVFLIADPSAISKGIDGAFTTDFWCFTMFKHYRPPGSMGILCDPRHPAFSEFPTEFHSNWQWWRLTKYARPMDISSLPADLRPIVQVIDNCERNGKYALAWEVRVGPGKLLVCSSDLLGRQDAPEVRQFMHSLLKYTASPEFNPATTIGMDDLKKLIGTP